MYRLVVLTILVLSCDAEKYASISFHSGDYVQPAAPVKLGAPAPVAYASQAGYEAPVVQAVPAPVNYGPVTAAIQTRRTVELRDVNYAQDYVQPQIINVQPNYEAVQIHFRTASSPLSVSQSHTPAAAAQVEHITFQDKPHRLVNEIVKPVIQEVREIIQPYRRITQEIRPVIEEIHTVVHKGEKHVVQAPLPLALAAPAYGPGATLSAGYKAAKAAKA